MQIRFFIIQNRAGKTRMAKWYQNFEEEEKQKLIEDTHAVVSIRGKEHTNFVEFRQYKIVYRRYAGLFFCLCVDVNDNDLAYMEAIHNFVEVLNTHFTSVSKNVYIFCTFCILIYVMFYCSHWFLISHAHARALALSGVLSLLHRFFQFYANQLFIIYFISSFIQQPRQRHWKYRFANLICSSIFTLFTHWSMKCF